MSDPERDVLRAVGIPQARVAEVLGMSPQRVSQALKSGRDFFDPIILRSFYLSLHAEDSGLAERFRAEVLKRFEGQRRKSLLEPAITARVDTVAVGEEAQEWPWRQAEEFWLFTPRPREIDSDKYRDAMATQFFRRRPNQHALKRIVYFVPPHVISRLKRDLAEIFEQIPKQERLERGVLVFETSAAAIVPPYAIFDPLSDHPEGWCYGEREEAPFLLSHSQTMQILDAIKEAGIAARGNTLELRPMPEDRRVPRFELRFNSDDY